MTEPVDPRHAVLLVMDYQVGILASLDGSDALVGRVADALASARSAGLPVGYVRVAFTEADHDAMPPTSRMGGRLASASARQMFADDSPATAIDGRLAPQPGDIVVRKTRVGAFSTTDLHDQLQRRDITTVVLAGISTSGVVLSTVRDASDRDYRVVVLGDACADRDPEVHRFLTERIFPHQAEVLTVADLAGVLGR